MTAAGLGFFCRRSSASSTPPLAQTAAMLVQELWAPFFVALLLTLLTGGRLDVARRLAAGGRVRAGAVDPAGRLAAVLRAGRQPPGRVPERRHRRRGRQGASARWPASPASPSRSSSRARWRAASRAAAPRAAAERRGQRGAAALRRAADQRPRHRLALADGALARGLLAGQRAGGVPLRAAALAPGPRRPGRPLPRPQDDARRRRCRRRWPRRSATRVSSSPTGCPGRSATPTPTGGPVLVPPVAPTLDRRGRERRRRARRARLRRVARRRPRAGRGRPRGREHGARERAPAGRGRARLAEVQASRERIVAAGDAERRRLERNLHDGAQQRLVAISLQLRLLQGRIGDDPSAQAARSTRERRARPVARRAARARARHPPRGARPRPRRRPRLARGALDGPDHGHVRGATAACPSRSSSRPTSWPPRRWPTSPSTRRRRRSRCASRAPAAGVDRDRRRRRRRRRRRPAARACAAWPIASRRSTGALRVVSPPGAGTVVTAELPCGS